MAHKEALLALHPVIGLVFQVGDVEALGLESLEPFIGVSKQGSYLTDIKEDGDDKRLAQLELACEMDGVALPDPLLSGHPCHCWGGPDMDFC